MLQVRPAIATDASAAAGAFGRSRIRRALATSASTIFARFVGFATLAAIVPLTVRHLGPERYGIWMTALSLVSLLSLANLGMSNALIGLIARSAARSDEREAAELISSALFFLTAAALFLGACAAVSFPYVPWDAIFNVPARGGVAADARSAAAAIIALYLIGMPAALAVQVRLGYQEGYVSGWWDAGASVATVAAVAIAVTINASFPVLVSAAAAMPLLGDVGNFAALVRRRPALRPRLGRVKLAQCVVLLRSGGLFLALQVAVLLAYTSDNVVTAQVLGPSAVTAYAVPARLALAGIALVTAFLSPLWPAYADALARGDHEWVKRTLRGSLIIASVLALAGSLVFATLGRTIVDLWSRGAVRPSEGLLIGLACWIVLSTAGAALAMFLNAAHVVGLQVVCSSVMAGVNIVLSVILAKKIGVAGVIWGTTISYTLCIVGPYAVFLPKVVARRLGTATAVSEVTA